MRYTDRPCGNTGAYHRLFDRTNPNEPRKSIGTICPRCGARLDFYDASYFPAVLVGPPAMEPH